MNKALRYFTIILLTLTALFILITAVYGTFVYIPSKTMDPSFDHFFTDISRNNLYSQSRNTMVHTGTLLLLTITLTILYRKSNYPEIVLFILGTALFANLDIYRLVFLLQTNGISRPYIALNMRVFFAFWLLGTGIFFINGLFPNGIPNLKQQEFLLLTALITISIVLLMPIDASLVRTQFPFTLSSRSFLVILVRMVEFFSILNFVIAGLKRNSIRLYTAAFGLTLFLVGNELFFFDPSAERLIIGAVSMVLGAFVFTSRINAEYLWT